MERCLDMKRLFPILLLIVVAMIFALCAQAELCLEATSGFILVNGPFSVSGPGFTFTGGLSICCCQSIIAPGQPIQGCDTGFDTPALGGGTLVLNGVTQPFAVIDSIPVTGQAPMFLSGATQATLTEPATIGDVFLGCLGNTVPCGLGFPGEPFFISNNPNTQLSVSLTLDSNGDYEVTNSVYTIITPEPGTDVFLLSGGLLFGLMMRKRIAHGLQQAS